MKFSGPKLKIERAKQHITDLQSFVHAFFQPDCYRFIEEENPETGEHIFRFEIIKPVPPETALFIGDAVHNLRSALDLLYCDSVLEVGGTPSKYTRFPIDETREKLVGPVAGGSIKHSIELQALILDKVKPYKTGNFPLWALNELDILDKHKLLIPVAQVTNVVGVDADIGSNTLRQCNFGMLKGNVMNLMAVKGMPVKIHNYGKPTFDILFDEGLPVASQPVIPTLNQFAEIVSGTIGAFTGFFGC